MAPRLPQQCPPVRCLWPLQEQDPDRKAAMHAIRDTRVDVCLYFIPPHRLRQARPWASSPACLARDAAVTTLHISSQHEAALPLPPILPQIDLRFMSELAAEVPVVPVLAKADTMTAEELKVCACVACPVVGGAASTSVVGGRVGRDGG